MTDAHSRRKHRGTHEVGRVLRECLELKARTTLKEIPKYVQFYSPSSVAIRFTAGR